MTKQLTLVLGGARSGKSAFGEQLARSSEKVLYVATAEARDEEMAERIALHRRRRPAQWDTLEEPSGLVGAPGPLSGRYDTILLDCINLWVSNLMLQDETGYSEIQAVAEVKQLLQLYDRGDASWILISNEVGLGIVPPSVSGRAFRDLLGRVNQYLARRADRVYFMVAGLALEMKSLGALPIETPEEGWA